MNKAESKAGNGGSELNTTRLNILLIENGLNQKEFAEKISITEASMSRYMHRTRSPRLRTMIRMAEVLGTSVDYLTTHDPAGESRIRVVLDEGSFPPVRAHAQDAGMDIMSPKDVQIPPLGSAVIDTGVHMEIPDGYAGVLISKSGLNVKHSITSTGLIDAGYKGSICVKLHNHGRNGYKVNRGDKISQLMIVPVMLCGIEIVDGFDVKTERGSSGFGSTGK